MTLYEEACKGRPPLSFDASKHRGGHSLFALCETLTEEQINVIPDLLEWYTFEKWWRNIPQEHRTAIINKEWRYD